MDNDWVNLKNVAYLVMDDFYRNRSARLSDEIKRVANETRVRHVLISFKIEKHENMNKKNLLTSFSLIIVWVVFWFKVTRF